VTLKPALGDTQGHREKTVRNQHVGYRSAAYDFLLTFHGNHGPISYGFRDKRWFQSKIAKFSHPVYFVPPLTGFSLELGTCARDQKN